MAEFLNETAFPVLVIAYITVRIATDKFEVQFPRPRIALAASLIVFGIMFGFRITADRVNVQLDAWEVLVTVIRSAIIAATFHYAFAMPAMLLLDKVLIHLRDRWAETKAAEERWRRQHNPPAESSPPPGDPPPEPRETVARTGAEQAKADYECDCEIIRAAGLDEDEQEAALVEAKQKYIRRLQEVLR